MKLACNNVVSFEKVVEEGERAKEGEEEQKKKKKEEKNEEEEGEGGE